MPLDRRSFLLWCAGAAVACTSEPSTGPAPSSIGERLDAVAMFHPDRVIVAGRPQRLPFALLGTPGLVADHQTLGVEVVFGSELLGTTEVAGHIAPHDHVGDPGVHEHSDQLRYYPLRLTLPEAGIYDLTVSAGAQRIAFPVQAFARDEVRVLQTGDSFPPVETPTLDDPRGVEPICTLHDGPCALHTVTPTEALAAGRPFVLFVGSPGYCANAFCTASLRLLIETAAEADDIDIIHAEPYSSPRSNGPEAPVDAESAPIMDALGLDFEPTVVAVDSQGTVVDRLDMALSEDEWGGLLTRLRK